MLDVIIWVAIIGSALCALVFLTLIVLVLFSLGSRMKNYALPPPDRAAERMYGQQYFDRAIGKKVD
jgi:hypothetical protein